MALDLHRSGSFRSRVTIAIQLLLFATFAFMAGLVFFFGSRAADTHAELVVRQGLLQTSARITGITAVAMSENDLLQHAARRQLREENRIDTLALMREMAPAFVARPTLTYLGVGLEATGEYAMLERIAGGARLRHFAVEADGSRRIADYALDEAGRAGPPQWWPHDGYDPRERPFYAEARAAGRAVWTETYIFRANDRRPPAIGTTLAVPILDAAGKLLAVTDTDFDTDALSAFMDELQHELPGRAFILETRRDHTFRVIAHSNYRNRNDLTVATLADEPAAQAVVARLGTLAKGAAPAPVTSRLTLDNEDYVVGFMPLAGAGAPPWVAVVVMPRTVVVAEVARQNRYSLIALGVVALAGVFLSRRVADSLVRPWTRMAEQVALYARGDEARAIDQDGPEEVTQFVRTFNDLVARVNARQAELQRAGAAERLHAQRLQRATETLRRIARLMSDFSQDERGCIERCARICCEALDVTRAAVWRADSRLQVLRLVAMYDAASGAVLEGREIDGTRYPEYAEAMRRDGRVVVADTASDPRTARLHADHLTHLGRVSLLDVPVMVHGEIVGICSFHLLNAERVWTLEEEILVLGVADLVALALERTARLDAEQTVAAQAVRQARQSAALAEVANVIHQDLPLDHRLRRITELACVAMHCTQAALVQLRDEEPACLVLLDQFHQRRGEHERDIVVPAARFPEYFNSLKGLRSRAVADVRTDRLYGPVALELWAGDDSGAVLDATFRVRGEPAGFVVFRDSGECREWFADEELFAAALADLVSLLFESEVRTRLEAEAQGRAARLVRQNAALGEANELVMTGAELLPTVRRLSELAGRALALDAVTVWLEEPATREVRQLNVFHPASGTHRAGITLAVAAYPRLRTRLQSARTVVFAPGGDDPDFADYYRDQLAPLGRVSTLLASMRMRGERFGVLGLLRVNRAEPWTEDEQVFAGAMADVLTLHVEAAFRAQIELELRARNERLTRQAAALSEINEVMLRLPPLTEAVQRIAEIAARALAADRATFWFQDEVTSELGQMDVFDVATGRHTPGLVLPRDAYPELRALLRSRRSVILDGAAPPPEFVDYHQRYLAGLGHVTLLNATLRLRTAEYGQISFLRINRAEPWSPEDEIFTGGVADILSHLVEATARRRVEDELRARGEQLVRQEQALSRVAASQALRSGQMTRAFHEMTEACAAAIGVHRAGIWHRDEESGRLRLVDMHDAERAAHREGVEIVLPPDSRYIAALVGDRSVAVRDAAADRRTEELWESYLAPSGVKSLLGAGVFSSGRLIGLVCFEHLGAPRDWKVEEEIFAGAIADLAALALEVSARRTAEDEIDRSRERLRLHIEGMPLAAIDWDRDARIIGWNPAAARIFGYPAEEIRGAESSVLLGNIPAAQPLRAELLLRRSGYVPRVPVATKAGRVIHTDWHNTALRDEQGKVIGVTSLVEDVTDRIRAEQEIRELNSGLEARVVERTAELAAANEKLKELDRLKSEFLATMSHELRTPLNSIIGFTGIIRAGMAGAVNDEQRKQLDMVQGSARHLLGLINDILDLSRVEAGKLRLELGELDVTAVLREAINTVEPMAQAKGLVCSLEAPDVPVRVRTDRKRLFQVAVNLVNNAVKFTEQGRVRLVVTPGEREVRVAVIDTGPGIREENLAGLFEPFRQADGSARRVYEGTGLGLYLCRKLLRVLGGEIGVETQFGAGCTFWFQLPVAGPAVPAEAESPQPFSHA